MIERIKIEAYQVGLVFENRKLIKVAEEGFHWIFGNKNVMIYDMNTAFQAPFELNILLENEVLAAMLEIVAVADNEIVLQFENGNFKRVLTAGRYAFWKGIVKNEFIKADISKIEITENIAVNLLENAQLRLFTRKYIVSSNDKALLFVNGTFVKELKAGTHYFWNNAITIEVKTVDARQQQVEISGQELLTKDKAGLRINFFVRYQVVDIMKALVDNKDFEKQLYVAMQLALRAFVGGLTLDEKGVSFEEAIEKLTEEYEPDLYTWASYGQYDLNMLKKQCKSFGIPYPMGDEHINVKVHFAEKFGLVKPTGMNGALHLLEIPLEGTHHRGIDDAKNIAKILNWSLKN